MNKRKRGNIWLFSCHPCLKVLTKIEKGGGCCPLAIIHCTCVWPPTTQFLYGGFSFFLFFDVRKHNVCAVCYYRQAELLSLPTRVGELACLASVHNWWTCCCVFDPVVWYVMRPALKLKQHRVSCREKRRKCYFVCLGDTTAGFVFFFSNIPSLFLSRPTPCGAVKCQ